MSNPQPNSLDKLQFPAEPKVGQVRSLLKTVQNLGDNISAAKVARELHMDVAALLPIVDAAEILRLVHIERGNVKLSRSGQEFLKATKPDYSQMKSLLRQVEPFKTGVELHRSTAEKIARELAKHGIRWHHEDTINVSVINEMLIHWGVASGLLEYDGYTSIFAVKSNS